MIARSHTSRREVRSITVVAILFCALASARPESKLPHPDNSWDIAVIDRALATEKPGDRWINFGDVGLTRQQLEIFRARLVDQQAGAEPNAVTPLGPTFKWSGGNVYYRFDPTQVGNSTITAGKMQAVRDAVAEWAAFANLNFIEFTTPLPANYITISQQANNEGGFSSSVGVAGGEQFIQIGPNSWNRGTICHEVGHALGLFHEQARDDRDTYVTINYANINSGDQANFNKIPAGTNAIGAYDYYSVMHYARAALTNKSGTPNPNAPDPSIDTIDPINVFFLNIIGSPFNRTLSKLDRAGMATIYGNPAALPSAIVTNTKDSGSGSLRTAIYYAFDRSTDVVPVPTTVVFHIPTSDSNYNAGTGVFTIRPTYLLTAPGAGTTIDGSSQTSFTGDTNVNGPEIVLDGSQIAAANLSLIAPGFLLRETNCTIKNVVINGFNQEGIALDGTRAALFGTATTGNVISGCYIGTDQNGTTGIGNGNMFAGIIMYGGAHHNTVGGTTAAARNVISGNTGPGILIQDAGSNSNVIEGNFIGLNAAGTGVLSNAFQGVKIFGGAQSNMVGTATAGGGNVISGNGIDGVFVSGTNTNSNVVQGNLVGLKAAGSSAAPNGGAGVDVVTGPQSTMIGPGNVISGNTASGVIVNAVNGTIVQGNSIGTNLAGTGAIPNSQAGVYVTAGAQNTVIGGLTSAARNVIAGNSGDGIDLNGVSNNFIEGNYLGVDTTGAIALANGAAGIALFNAATLNTIGGSVPGARNIISGNIGDGINLNGGASDTIAGNYIGLDSTGINKIANGGAGVDIFGGPQNLTIGGTTIGVRNYISGNATSGIALGFATSNFIQGNTIGLNVAGLTQANGAQGIAVFGGAQLNTIGGSTAGASNILAGNTNEGVAFFGSSTNQNAVSGNSIFGNHFVGIGLYSGSNNNQAAPMMTGAALSTMINPNGTDVSGTLDSAANATFRLEFFASPGGTDEGKNFIGATSVTTNGSGHGSFAAVHLAAALPIAPVQTGGSVVTATATDSSGNTSQFSSPFSVTAVDTDSDGIPDNWMSARFGHVPPLAGEHANEDYDGDGLTNFQEFLAGTDPKSVTSALRITATTRSGSDVSVTFNSIAGKTYRIESKGDLSAATWTPVEDQILAVTSATPITDSGALGLTKRFYRVVLEP